MSERLSGWRLSAGDEHTIMDGRSARLASIPCGGMSGRTFSEAAEIAAFIANAPARITQLEADKALMARALRIVRDDLGDSGPPMTLGDLYHTIDEALTRIGGGA